MKNGLNDYLGQSFSDWDYLSEFFSRTTKIQTYGFSVLFILFFVFLFCK